MFSCSRDLSECLLGNASQISDGAAAVVLARRSVAKRLGLPIVGKYVAATVAGVPPRIMGVGPLYAIPKVLEKIGLSKDDVDFYEINEAFASQVVYCVDKLGIPHGKVNVNGGAIAFGHPLGCSTSLSSSASQPKLSYSFYHNCSWSTSNCYWLEHRQAEERENIRDKHVYRFWHGNGRCLGQRALN